MWRNSGLFGKLTVTVMGWSTLLYLVFPLIVVIGVSVGENRYLEFPPQGFTLKWYGQFLEDPSYLEAFWLSAQLGALSTFLALLLGVTAALVIARKRFPGRQAISAMFLSPLILPSIVIGVAILQYVSLLGFARTFSALVAGHVVLIIPYVIRTSLASLSGINVTIEEAAQDLGATSQQTFFLVTLPQIKPGVIAGALFAFIISWINVEVSIFNSTAAQMTLPVKIFNYVQYQVDPILAAVSSITIFVAIIAVLLLDMIVGVEKLTAGA